MKTIVSLVCFALALTSFTPFISAQQIRNVRGVGTVGRLPVWLTANSVGNSALFQSGANVAIGTTTPQARFDVVSNTPVSFRALNTATTGFPSAGFFQVTGTAGAALTAVASSDTGTTVGIFAQTSCQSCGAIIGQQLATGGEGSAVTGRNASTDGVGISGVSTATTGFGQGLYAETNSPSGIVALLRSQAPGGNLVIGQAGVGVAAVDVFRVDTDGKGFFNGGTQTGGADFAESVAIQPGPHYGPGDLLALDAKADRRLTLTAEPYSTRVAGIYSTKPGVLATPHSLSDSLAGEAPLAIVGIVPCKVTAENGSIERGDLLVSSSLAGYAMKGTDRSRMLGAVVGKALQPLQRGTGVIEVLVTLQ